MLQTSGRISGLTSLDVTTVFSTSAAVCITQVTIHRGSTVHVTIDNACYTEANKEKCFVFSKLEGRITEVAHTLILTVMPVLKHAADKPLYYGTSSLR